MTVTRAGSTTHISVADRTGNVVSYTFTIESTGGAGLVVPGYGFLLNNELTDFNFDSLDAPQPRAAGQAPAQLDGADDRAARRQAVAHRRHARRLDDHHDRAAAAHRPHRPRHDAAAGDRRAAREPAQHADADVEAAFLQSPEAAALAARGHTFAAARPRSARRPAIESQARRQHDGRGRAGPPRRRQRARGDAQAPAEPSRCHAAEDSCGRNYFGIVVDTHRARLREGQTMNLDGIHHITAITGDAPRNVDFYTRVLGPADDRQDRQPGRPERLPPLLRRRERPARRRPDVLRVPRREPGPRGRGHGAPDRLARRVAGGARLLGRAPRRRRRRDRARRRPRLLLRRPRGPRARARRRRDRRRAADRRPPGDPGRARAAGLRGRARLQLPPRRQRARARAADGRDARATTSDASSCAASAAAAGSPATRRPPSAAARAPAPSTTSRGARPTPTCRLDRPRHRRRDPELAATSTATTSTRCTSASRAACSTSWRRESPASPSTAPSRSSARRLILPPFLEPRRAEIEARLTPLPDPRADRARASAAPTGT